MYGFILGCVLGLLAGCVQMPPLNCADPSSVAQYETRASGIGASSAALYVLSTKDPARVARVDKVLAAAETHLSTSKITLETLRTLFEADVKAIVTDPEEQRRLLQTSAAVEGGVLALMGVPPEGVLPTNVDCWRRLCLAAVKGARRQTAQVQASLKP